MRSKALIALVLLSFLFGCTSYKISEVDQNSRQLQQDSNSTSEKLISTEVKYYDYKLVLFIEEEDLEGLIGDLFDSISTQEYDARSINLQENPLTISVTRAGYNNFMFQYEELLKKWSFDLYSTPYVDVDSADQQIPPDNEINLCQEDRDCIKAYIPCESIQAINRIYLDYWRGEFRKSNRSLSCPGVSTTYGDSFPNPYCVNNTCMLLKKGVPIPSAYPVPGLL